MSEGLCLWRPTCLVRVGMGPLVSVTGRKSARHLDSERTDCCSYRPGMEREEVCGPGSSDLLRGVPFLPRGLGENGQAVKGLHHAGVAGLGRAAVSEIITVFSTQCLFHAFTRYSPRQRMCLPVFMDETTWALMLSDS